MRSVQRHLYALITGLFVFGIGLFAYHHWILKVPLTDHENMDSWLVEAHLKFDAEKDMPVKASFTIPYMPPGMTILDEYFISKNYGVTTNVSEHNRHVVWSLRRGQGAQSLYYRAILQESMHEGLSLGRPRVLLEPALTEDQRVAADTIIARARQSSADIQTFAQSTVKELSKADGHAKLLMNGELSEASLVYTAAHILNLANIHATPVQGFYLSPQNKVTFHWLLAVYNEKNWLYIRPDTASLGLPKDFLIWQYGDEPLYSLSHGKKPVFELMISPASVSTLNLMKNQSVKAHGAWLRFSLLQLPVNVQEMYKVLMTVPVGAFIILLLRQFVGLKTFGTFMPVLIALAFRETHVFSGILLFILIISLGLLARFYLDQLRLLLVPRLASILTIVIFLMVLISVVSHQLGLDSGLAVALFPMIILTMTIERMCILWDERGPWDAIKATMGSLFAAVIAFSVMNKPGLQYLIFTFPELLCVVLGFILLFGQYRGYRLTELIRFKALASKH